MVKDFKLWEVWYYYLKANYYYNVIYSFTTLFAFIAYYYILFS